MRDSVSDEASAATGSPRPQRIRRWLRRIVVAIAALALGSVVIALVVLHTDWGREQLRRQAVSAVAEMFPGGFELDGIEGSVLGTVTLRDVVIYDQKRRRAVAVERVSIDLGMVALLRHTIRLERLDIEGLTVRAFDDDQGLNLTALLRPRQSDSASAWRVQLDDVRLERGAFAVTKPSADLSGKLVSDHFDDIAIRSTATIDPGGSVTSSVTIGLRWRERNVTAELHGSAKFNDGVVEVARADARVGSVRGDTRASICVSRQRYRKRRGERGQRRSQRADPSAAAPTGDNHYRQGEPAGRRAAASDAPRRVWRCYSVR
jgi:uncharacterized protein involved in outer membrane biogenesis